ncbi:hypothetical protein [Flavobacterium sp.]|uniref:hypothetical protein n=1 Tax=Flavobacterium sp. TaxID=239 RepID=UPI0039E21984
MKTEKKFQPTFEKSTPKTTEQIKAAIRQADANQSDYQIRSNGDHIWVEIEPEKKQYWSPMLHLRLVKSENETRIKGKFGENPLLWLVFLGVKLSSIGIFALSGIIAYLKYRLDYNFNTQLFVMFGMVSVWFAMYLASERYRRKGKQQIADLRDFVDGIAA